MRTIGICLLLILTPTLSLGKVPDSILGSWDIDLIRTMSEHFDRVAKARPDLFSSNAAQSQKKAMLSGLAAQTKAQATLTFTKDKLISTQADSASVSRSYSDIGGNSRLVIIASADEDGYESVVRIRLVDGGIAIETTNCREHPDQCQRERLRALEQLRKKHQVDSSTNTIVDGGTAVIGGPEQSNLDGLSSSVPSDDLSQPKWIYFKKAATE